MQHVVEKKAHSLIGASSAERWMNCPGSITLYKDLESSSSKYADEGSAAHMVAELYLSKLLPIDYSMLDDTIVVESGEEITITEEMIDAVGNYIAHVYATLAEDHIPLSALQIEKEFNLSHIDAEAFGTCDALAVGVFRIYVWDYKHGKGVKVSAEGNTQAMYYALGAYYSVPEEHRSLLLDVMVSIAQPRAGGISSWVVTIPELLQFERDLTSAIVRIRAEDTTVKAGKWCRFCKGKAVCPAMRDKALGDAKLQFMELGALDTKKPKITVSNDIRPKEIAEILDAASFINDWLAAVREYAQTLVTRGIDVPGYTVQTGVGNRAWVPGAEEALRAVYGDLIYSDEKPMLSPRQMEIKLAKHKLPLDAIAANTVKPTTAPCLKRGPGGPNVDPIQTLISEARKKETN